MNKDICDLNIKFRQTSKSLPNISKFHHLVHILTLLEKTASTTTESIASSSATPKKIANSTVNDTPTPKSSTGKFLLQAKQNDSIQFTRILRASMVRF